MKKIDIDKIYSILKKEVRNYKTPVAELIQIRTKDPFKVLVTALLSARTNDNTTEKAVGRLFLKAPTLKKLSELSEKEIAEIIFPVGFYKNKAKFLKHLPDVLEKLFDSQIPDNIESLIKLPGVGRKTANLVVAVAFNKPAICVDTHVHRITNIWGYVKTKTPLETEMELRKKLPEKYWITFNTILVAYGQHTCRPVSPHCKECVITDYCPRIGLK